MLVTTLTPNLNANNNDKKKKKCGTKSATQYLFNTDVADKNLHLSSVSVESWHCVSCNPSWLQEGEKKEQNGSGMREEDLSVWWREWQRQEKWVGETGKIKGAETDSERRGFVVSEQQQAGRRGNRRRHGKSLSLQQSQGLVLNAAAPRQPLVWGWHAAVPGYVGVTSAPGPGGLKTQGCLSREEGQSQAQTHCGNWADLAKWGPSDGKLT